MAESKAELIKALCELGNAQYMRAVPGDPYSKAIVETAMAVVNSIRADYGLERVELK